MKKFKFFSVVFAMIFMLSVLPLCSFAEVDGQAEDSTSVALQTTENSEDQKMLPNPITSDLSYVFYALSVASAVFALGLFRVSRK